MYLPLSLSTKAVAWTLDAELRTVLALEAPVHAQQAVVFCAIFACCKLSCLPQVVIAVRRCQAFEI